MDITLVIAIALMVLVAGLGLSMSKAKRTVHQQAKQIAKLEKDLNTVEDELDACQRKDQ